MLLTGKRRLSNARSITTKSTLSRSIAKNLLLLDGVLIIELRFGCTDDLLLIGIIVLLDLLSGERICRTRNQIPSRTKIRQSRLGILIDIPDALLLLLINRRDALPGKGRVWRLRKVGSIL